MVERRFPGIAFLGPVQFETRGVQTIRPVVSRKKRGFPLASGRAALCCPKKEKHFSTPKRTMPGGFHNHDVPPGDDDAGLVPRVSVPRH
ncbi:MAG: hypothetical protein MSH25_07555, partial [Desulfovibrio sp.]|uniref:hypothetical protein n=1 Tax=Desulfovibrio sp. TaxID=885 RepID=UPI0025B84982